MSSPAASWALMIAATASWYCSRNIESPSAALNERPKRFWSYQRGRGYEPVMAVGSIMSRVTRSMYSSVDGTRTDRRVLFMSEGVRRAQRMARRVVEKDLLATEAGDNVVAEAGTRLLQRADLAGKVIDLELNPVPTARLGLASVRHRPGRLLLGQQTR